MSPLVVEKATKKFRQGERSVAALSAISLEVQQGSFLAIMGASGSGKSTLLHLMAGLTQPDSGAVLVNGVNLTDMSDKELTLFRRKNIGLVFQAFNLIPTLTARENVALPLTLSSNGSNHSWNMVDDLLNNLSLRDRKDHRPDALSGGEQQRVAIGRALVSDPAVILADEPTGNLDSANGRAVCQLLKDLSTGQGKTIVVVTHEPSVAVYASEVAILRDGQLVQRFGTEGLSGQNLAARYQEILG